MNAHPRVSQSLGGAEAIETDGIPDSHRIWGAEEGREGGTRALRNRAALWGLSENSSPRQATEKAKRGITYFVGSSPSYSPCSRTSP